MERYDITIQMYSADASGTQYVWEKVPAEEGDFVLYADAQATIAALQAEVKDLKEWLAAYKQSIELAQSSLTQRTAELEATEKAYQDKTRLYIEQTGAVADLQAELERVSALVKALPKVEGEIVAQAGYVKDRKKVYACFGSDADMTAYAALLTHRQGMEG